MYYRLVAQARREDGMQRETNMKSYYLAPSVTMEFTPQTSLTLLAACSAKMAAPPTASCPPTARSPIRLMAASTAA
ncbi:hypothetical protein [Comamonas sp. JC664]|uniref:hypothetical protein n=1 Tax=Comamonas sp. JC664 TaxID=2801917 RepID=UPI003611588E